MYISTLMLGRLVTPIMGYAYFYIYNCSHRDMYRHGDRGRGVGEEARGEM